MFELKKFYVLCLILSFLANAFGYDIILNEYNAVSSSNFLNGGDYITASTFPVNNTNWRLRIRDAGVLNVRPDGMWEY